MLLGREECEWVEYICYHGLSYKILSAIDRAESVLSLWFFVLSGHFV